MLDTRLPLPYLELLPSFLFETIDGSMFPSKWHIFLNNVWLVQGLVAILGCVLDSRWIMNHKKSSNFLVIQFYSQLYLHSLFYILEILITSVSTKYFNMLIHHIFAILIFVAIIFSKHTVSVLLLLPFISHAMYWLDGYFDNRTLALYNFILLYVGISTVFISILSRGKLINRFIPILCIAETACNYFTWCVDFRGKECIIALTGTWSQQERMRENVYFIGGLTVLVTVACFALAYYIRDQQEIRGDDQVKKNLKKKNKKKN